MPPLYRILEVALYSILNFLPYIMLALYHFRGHYRFSRKITIMLIAAITAVQICLGVLAAFSETSTGLLSLASTAIYAAFYFTAVKAHFGKTLFTLLMLSNIANFIVSASKCIEGILAYEYAVQSYRFTFSAVMGFIEILFLIPLFFYIKTHIRIFLRLRAENRYGDICGLYPQHSISYGSITSMPVRTVQVLKQRWNPVTLFFCLSSISVRF